MRRRHLVHDEAVHAGGTGRRRCPICWLARARTFPRGDRIAADVRGRQRSSPRPSWTITSPKPEEHLVAVRRCLLLLEPVARRCRSAVRGVEELFRSFHSLKGISAMVELREAERLAHRDGERASARCAIGDFVLSGPELRYARRGATCSKRDRRAKERRGHSRGRSADRADGRGCAEGIVAGRCLLAVSRLKPARQSVEGHVHAVAGAGGARRQGGHGSRAAVGDRRIDSVAPSVHRRRRHRLRFHRGGIRRSAVSRHWPATGSPANGCRAPRPETCRGRAPVSRRRRRGPIDAPAAPSPTSSAWTWPGWTI